MNTVIIIVVVFLAFLLLRRFIDKGTRSNLGRLLLLLFLAFLLFAVSVYRLSQ